ncbi:MAG: hypothetical protein WCS86_03715 [Candidatus Paceibacterota bacterium]
MKAVAQKTIKYLILVILIAFSALFYFYKSQTLKQTSAYKCPEDYTEDDAGTTEYRNALINWTSSFFEANPKATSSDWSIAKLKLLEDRKCVVALQRLKMSGNVANLKPWEQVDWAIQNSLDKATNSTN